MNLPALWAYGAGITTGLLWAHGSETSVWKVRIGICFLMLCLWPFFFACILIDWIRGLDPWRDDL
jgi:hypothetical protein